MRWYVVGAEVLFLVGLAIAVYRLFLPPSPGEGAVAVNVKLADPSLQVYLQKGAGGELTYLVRGAAGGISRLSSQEMAEKLYQAGSSTLAVLGLSSPVVAFWLGLGVVGQVLFTGRMVVQWIASERQKKSVVPPLFWWMSLIGSLVLLSYFLWRRDPIGLLGQAFGSFIYLKNLLWIRNEARQPALATVDAS